MYTKLKRRRFSCNDSSYYCWDIGNLGVQNSRISPTVAASSILRFAMTETLVSKLCNEAMIFGHASSKMFTIGGGA